MAYFENDASVLTWLDAALLHQNPHIRRQAVRLLEHIDCPRREEWLERAQTDLEPSVAACAVVAASVVTTQADFSDLFESDLASGLEAEDLQWEWEYELVVCDRFNIPPTRVLAWTKAEDDATAREIALLKCYAGKEHEKSDGTALIVSKRLVTRYTRSPRSYAEATMWAQAGRPKYPAS